MKNNNNTTGRTAKTVSAKQTAKAKLEKLVARAKKIGASIHVPKNVRRELGLTDTMRNSA